MIDVNYNFNEKSVEEIIKVVKEEPFCPVMLHIDDISVEIIELIKRLSEFKEVWLQSNTLFYEDFANMNKETIMTFGIDRIKVMIDALEDEIDIEKSLNDDNLVSFIYEEVPF